MGFFRKIKFVLILVMGMLERDEQENVMKNE
jgi:hypothetical protein